MLELKITKNPYTNPPIFFYSSDYDVQKIYKRDWNNFVRIQLKDYTLPELEQRVYLVSITPSQIISIISDNRDIKIDEFLI